MLMLENNSPTYNAALGDYPREISRWLITPKKCRVGGLCATNSALGDYSPVNAALEDYPRKLHAVRLFSENFALLDHPRKMPMCAGSSQGKCPARSRNLQPQSNRIPVN